MRNIRPVFCAVCVLVMTCIAFAYDLDAVPQTPEGFKTVIVAKEPALLHPAALCFDAKGRLFVGGGPQFRKPSPDTPPDSIQILIDHDEDGKADEIKTFATGFNCIQALAWKGGDLYVANCPDVTIVRDLDGDDVADEYVRVFTGLGHLRHGLHGFNWGPDGKLYMTQGNSRVQKHAPKPFRDLMHVESDAPATQPVEVFKPEDYQRSYIGSWPSAEGGVLRCDPLGKNLEIYSRGYRNPWDMAMDDGFHWLATDNDDGPEHDRFITPFFGSHFGKVHPWSYSWTGENNPPTAPASGLFPSSNGSGVGVVYYTANQLPARYRGCYLIGDWTRKEVYVFRPKWQGALMTNADGWDDFELLAWQGKSSSLFRPTDLAVGPGGAVYVAGWGSNYGSKHAPYRGSDKKIERNEGRIFRIWYDEAPLIPRSQWYPAKRRKPYNQWTVAQLVEDLGHQIHVWRVNAQDELVRRGGEVADELVKAVEGGDLNQGQQTWAVWALGRMSGEIVRHDVFVRWAGKGHELNLRLQALRILGFRWAKGEAAQVAQQLKDDAPRVRFAAAQALRQMHARDQVDQVIQAITKETDRLCEYSLWRGLGELAAAGFAVKEDGDAHAALKSLLRDERPKVRRAALLALLEEDVLEQAEVLLLTADPDESVASVASLWMEKAGKMVGPLLAIEPQATEFHEPIDVTLNSPLDDVTIHYTLDGSTPTSKSATYGEPISVERNTTVKAVLYRNGKPIGPVFDRNYHWVDAKTWNARLRITDVLVENKRRYRLVENAMQPGARLYNDRDYTFKDVPPEILGATYIMTSNNDESIGDRDDDFLTFEVSQPAAVYVAHDMRIDSKPAWMGVGREDGFVETDGVVDTTDVKFRVYRKVFPAGVVKLGTNASGGRGSMYYVAIRKANAAGQPVTTMADVLPLVEEADAKRGESLFFKTEGGIGCHQCHRIGDKGTALGPDLSDLGLRAKARDVVQSILDPNAVVIEGFLQSIVETEAGDQFFGLIREESAKAITLYQGNGQPVVIPKEQIFQRRLLDRSPMPANFGALLTPRDAADMTAWLLTLKNRKANTPADEKIGFDKD